MLITEQYLTLNKEDLSCDYFMAFLLFSNPTSKNKKYSFYNLCVRIELKQSFKSTISDYFRSCFNLEKI